MNYKDKKWYLYQESEPISHIPLTTFHYDVKLEIGISFTTLSFDEMCRRFSTKLGAVQLIIHDGSFEDLIGLGAYDIEFLFLDTPTEEQRMILHTSMPPFREIHLKSTNFLRYQRDFKLTQLGI